MQFNREFCLENYYGRILTSRVKLLVNKQSYSWQYAICGLTYRFEPDESDHCWNITGLGFAIEPIPDHVERHPQSSNN
jgi:hypothetical protein